MATNFSLILFITLSFAFCSHADLISDKCGNTSYPNLCISTLRSKPKSGSSDLNGLIQYMFGAMYTKAVPVPNTINQALKKITDPVSRKAYNGCLAEYTIILSKLRDIIKIVGKDNRQVVSGAKEVINRADNCDSAFTEVGLITRFAPTNSLVKKLATIGGQMALNTLP